MPESVVYLNGEFIAAQDAKVSVLDRGFLFGDGVYEVIPAYAGRLFRLPEHLDRLQRSLRGVRIADPYDRARWTAVLDEVVARNGRGDQSVYLQITRGVAPTRTHAFPPEMVPTVFAMSSPLHTLNRQRRERGAHVITHEDIRWRLCGLKTTAMLANVLLVQMARDANAEETLLIRDGHVIEGASSNVFAVREGAVVTPPADARLLPGITRDLVLELAADAGFRCREEALPVAALAAVDELWITSGSRRVMPVVAVDGRAVGSGVAGPVWRRVAERLDNFIEQLAEAGADDG